MKEIKFRAFFNGKMVPAMSLQEMIHQKVNTIPLDMLYEDVIFMQYTGLKDKNDNEIYEGDLVDLNGVYEVKFGEHGVPSVELQEYVDNATGFYFKAQHNLKNIEPFGYDIPMNEIYARECEIIGNIYENPELLEDEQ